MSLSSIAPFSAGTAGPASPEGARRTSDALRAASMLEGLFLRQLMKVMRETVPESALFGENMGHDIFTQMLDETIADQAATGEGIGLRQMLLDQLGGKIAHATTPRRAAATLRHIASLGQVNAAEGPLQSAGQNSAGQTLGGVGFEAPQRPHDVQLKDPDGRLRWPVHDSSPRVDSSGMVQANRGADILAAGSGQIIEASSTSLVIEHGCGLRTRYSGLGQVLAQPGDLVLRGQAIGAVAPTGSFQFGVLRQGRELQSDEITALLLPMGDSQEMATQVR